MIKKSHKSIFSTVLAVVLMVAILYVFYNYYAPADKKEVSKSIVLDGTLSRLQFESETKWERMKDFDRLLTEFTDSGWRSVGYEEVGNFYEKRWCTGSGAPDDCMASSSTANYRDQHVLSLSTLHYTDNPEFFGIEFSAKKVPDYGWGATFYYSEDGGSIVADGFGITFDYFSKGREPQKSVNFGQTYVYDVYEKKLYYNSPNPLIKDVETVLSSAESMRNYGLNTLNNISNQVYDYIRSGDAVRCEYETYRGDGVPPRCIKERPLTEEEKKESTDKAQQYFSEQMETLNNNYVDMYHALADAFPFEVFDFRN